MNPSLRNYMMTKCSQETLFVAGIAYGHTMVTSSALLLFTVTDCLTLKAVCSLLEFDIANNSGDWSVYLQENTQVNPEYREHALLDIKGHKSSCVGTS